MPHPTRSAAIILACALASACGKKGAPLAPLIHVPGAIQGMTARRVGDDVFLSVPAPAANVDGSLPPDLRRVEVYAATATSVPPRPRFLEIATLVATVDVPAADSAAAPASAAGKPATQTFVVRDRLTSDALIPRTLAPVARARVPVPPLVRETSTVPQRFYLAIPYNDRGTPGPPGTPLPVALDPAPDPPEGLRLSYGLAEVRLEWDPSGGIVGFLLESPLPMEALDDAAATPELAASAGPTRYNVYRTLAPDPLALPAAPPAAAAVPVPGSVLPSPMNPMPVAELSFTDEVEFGRERCYQIRAVRGAAAAAVEGRASKPQCVTPLDIYPPAIPTGLSAVAAAGSISLIWEASPDPDTAGYMVLRGSSADATLQTITAVPVTDTNFTDRTVVSGTRYSYAVVAVDARVPVPNISEPSSRVEETAR